LEIGLHTSPCHFKVVLNSVPVSQLNTSIFKSPDDRWQGWPAQREKLMASLADPTLRNVWWLTGDLHVGLVMKVEPTGIHSRMWEIAMGPAGNMCDWRSYRQVPADQFLFKRNDFSATTMRFDPAADSVQVKFFNPKTNQVLFNQAVRFGQ
jgi:alkaline phosphatase D